MSLDTSDMFVNAMIQTCVRRFSAGDSRVAFTLLFDSGANKEIQCIVTLLTNRSDYLYGSYGSRIEDNKLVLYDLGKNLDNVDGEELMDKDEANQYLQEETNVEINKVN